MDYIQASKRYNLDKFLNQIKNLDYLDLLTSLNNEISNVESIKIPRKNQYKRNIEYLQIKYISDLKGLGFLLSQGIKPATIDNNTLLKFKPILKELIDKKQLKATILNLIE